MEIMKRFVIEICKEMSKYLNYKLIYDKSMDKECIDICNAMNSIPGISTFESCSGHNKKPFRIYFNSTDQQGLFFLTRCIDQRYWEYGHQWSITLSVNDLYKDILPTVFLLQSTSKGSQAIHEANCLINNFMIHLNHENFFKAYKLDIEKFKYKTTEEN